jgi:outer membrane protein
MFRTLIAASLLCAASPLLAQGGAGSQLPDPNDRSNTFTLAVGAAAVPYYEGSDDYKLIPAVAVRGRVAGMDFWSSGTKLYLDLIGRPSSGIDFDVGPIVGARFNRSGKIKDDAVDALPELDVAIEVGAFGGISLIGLTNPYDALNFRVDYLADVGGAHKSSLITPSVSFSTPLSRTFYVSASASAEWAGDGYADYYYSVSPAESLASGLAVYEADGGFKEWRLGLTALSSFSGDLTHGWAVFASGSYAHLAGDFADSPIVDDRGSASQWLAAVGVAYTF